MPAGQDAKKGSQHPRYRPSDSLRLYGCPTRSWWIRPPCTSEKAQGICASLWHLWSCSAIVAISMGAVWTVPAPETLLNFAAALAAYPPSFHAWACIGGPLHGGLGRHQRAVAASFMAAFWTILTPGFPINFAAALAAYPPSSKSRGPRPSMRHCKAKSTLVLCVPRGFLAWRTLCLGAASDVSSEWAGQSRQLIMGDWRRIDCGTFDRRQTRKQIERSSCFMRFCYPAASSNSADGLSIASSKG